MILTEERVILIERARHYFAAHLRHALSLSVKIDAVEQTDNFVLVNGERFDYLIDATWGHFTPVPLKTFFEPTLLLYFEGAPNLPAVTFVDGPLYSIYPTEEAGVYTLSSVPHTPLGRYASSAEACAARDAIDSEVINAKLRLMVDQACENVAYFRDHYRFLGPQISIKTKPIGGSDDRSCYVGRQGRIFSVMSGKIDTIFFATERILNMMEADGDGAAPEIPSSLLANIRTKAAQVGLDVG